MFVYPRPSAAVRHHTVMSGEVDPQEFVQRIRQMGEQQNLEDRERVRKLEEDVIAQRAERLARRAGGCTLTPLMSLKTEG